MSKPSGKLSVREAVKRCYPLMPRRFSMMKLHSSVVREINRPYLHPDTTRRKAMELREEGLISFENVSKPKAIYHKTDKI